MAINDLILYSTEDGKSHFVLHEMGGQAWLTQLELAELYQTTKQKSACMYKTFWLRASFWRRQPSRKT